MDKIKPPLGSVKTWERLEELQKTPGAMFHAVSFYGSSMKISKRFRAWDFAYDGVTLACQRQRYWPEGYARIGAHMFPFKGDFCQLYTKPDKPTLTQFVIFSSKSAADVFCHTLHIPVGAPPLNQEFAPPERAESALAQGVRNGILKTTKPEAGKAKSMILEPAPQLLDPPPYRSVDQLVKRHLQTLDMETTDSVYVKKFKI